MPKISTEQDVLKLISNQPGADFLLTRHFIAFLASPDGLITDLWTKNDQILSENHLFTLFKDLSKGRRLQEFFDVPEKEGVLDVDLTSGVTQYPLRRGLEESAYAHSVTLLPAHFCTLFPENGGFLGLIYSMESLPFLELEDPVVYYDSSGSVVACNYPFLSLLGPAAGKFAGVLERKLDEFLKETPESLLAFLVMKEASRMRMPGGREPGNPVFSHPTCFTAAGAGHAVLNRERDIVLMTLPEAVPFREEGFCLSFTFTGKNMALPLVMLGSRGFPGNSYLTPDQAGYSIGPDAAEERVLLKRRGYLVAAAPISLQRGKVRKFELVVFERFFMLKADGAPIFHFYDFNAIQPSSFYVNIGFRAGAEGEITGVRIGPAGLPVWRPDIRSGLVRFRNAPTRFYQFSFIGNPHLREKTLLIRGIVMHEVTPLQEQVEEERERGKRLSRQLQGTADFVGVSPQVRKLLEYAEVVARSSITVLLQGPTGSGKEVLARHIHQNSAFRGGPFVKMDCSTIPATLFESHLFGYVRGAFTGAGSDSMGVIESANNGTLFIDEINNLSADAQAKLLHVLQDAVITRVGSNQPVRLNIRAIVAGNRDLEEEVRAGRFRQDLYYRINAALIRLPPLKEHPEDIPALCAHFIRQYNLDSGRAIASIEPGGLELLMGHTWPGNIRELKNVMTHACIFTQGTTVLRRTLAESLSGVEGEPLEAGGKPYVGMIDRAAFSALLKKFNGSASKVSEALGVSRNTVYYNLKRFGLDMRDFKV